MAVLKRAIATLVSEETSVYLVSIITASRCYPWETTQSILAAAVDASYRC